MIFLKKVIYYFAVIYFFFTFAFAFPLWVMLIRSLNIFT